MEQINKVKYELIRLNTKYQRDYNSPKLWAMTKNDVKPTVLTEVLTENEINNRHIGAVTAIQEIYDFIKQLSK